MTNLRPILIWGAGGHARVIANAIRQVGEYDVVGFIDTVSPDRKGQRFAGSKIIVTEDELAQALHSGIEHLFVAVGDNFVRQKLAEHALAMGFHIPPLIHPAACVAEDVSIGDGTFIAPGVIANPATVIGQYVILNSSCVIEHDCHIEHGVHIGPGAIVAGHVKIHQGTFIGAGAVIKDHLVIGPHATVGAGAVVIHDLEGYVVATGIPARSREKNE